MPSGNLRRAEESIPHQELYQIDTSNILFICGGAFEGIDKIIEKRIDQKSIGFNAEIAENHEDNLDRLLNQVLPQDLVKFGLIPEFVGRVPVVVALESLNRDALIQILTEPKSSIVKQYQKLMELDASDCILIKTRWRLSRIVPLLEIQEPGAYGPSWKM